MDKLVFTDEKRFKLDGPDGCTYYWHNLTEERELFSKSHFSSGITIWGSLYSSGNLIIHFCDEVLNSHNYQKILKTKVLPNFDKSKHIFQQDNATCHVSKSTFQWLNDNEINFIEWPALSCDLNIIENI